MPDIQIFGSHEPNTLAQLQDVASRAERAALMADGHLGYVMPIGGGAAYRDKVSVVGVGFDIACGNAAIRCSGIQPGTRCRTGTSATACVPRHASSSARWARAITTSTSSLMRRTRS